MVVNRLTDMSTRDRLASQLKSTYNKICAFISGTV